MDFDEIPHGIQRVLPSFRKGQELVLADHTPHLPDADLQSLGRPRYLGNEEVIPGV